MGIRIKFDAAHNPEVPTIILAKRNGDKLGQLNAYNISLSGSVGDSEISFKVYKYIDNVKCDLWEQIVDFKLIYCIEWDMWFEITVELNEAEEIYKTIYCTCLGNAELSQIMLYDIEINTENDISREDYTIPTVLYDPFHIESSLLHRIMEKAGHYKIIHVDNSIASIQRTFTFNDISIYDAFKKIETELNCVFVLHSNSDENGKISRTISVFDLESKCLSCDYRGEFTHVCPECGSMDVNEGYGKDTKIFISSDKLANDIQFKTDCGSVKNCFKLVAGDDLMTSTIRNCNPNGTDYIWYFSDATKSEMSNELAERIESYDIKYKLYQKEHSVLIDDLILNRYNELIRKYQEYNPELEELSVPIIGYPNLMNAYYNAVDMSLYLQSSLMTSVEMMDTTATEEIKKLTSQNLSPVAVTNMNTVSVSTVDNAVLSMAKILVDKRYKIRVSSSTLEKGTQYHTWNGSFVLENYSNEEDTAISNSVSVRINGDYATFVNQKINKTIKDSDTDDLSISGLFSKTDVVFENELKKYSLNCLLSFQNACQTCIDVLIEQGIGNKETWSGGSPNLYEDLYLKYINRLSLIESEVAIRQDELNIIIGVYDENGELQERGLQNYIEDEKLKIQSELNFEEYLGEDLLLEFNSFRREDKYSNDNFISDGLNNAEIFKKALEFIQVAQKEIMKSSEMQHSIATTLKNLLVIKEFEALVEDFETGNWLRIQVDDDIYKLRLIRYSIDFDNIENLPVEFSDVVNIKNSIVSVKEILNRAESMSTSYNAVQRQAKQGEESKSVLKNWTNKGLDVTNTRIIAGSNNQSQTWDEHGMLFRKYDSISESYDRIQLKIVNSTLAITDDNWESVKTAIGAYYYYHPKTGELTMAYGVNAETIVGKLILGEQLGLYNESGNLTFDENGLKIFSNINQNSFKVDPNSDVLLAINNGTRDIFFVDDSGMLHIIGDGSGLDISSNADIAGINSQLLVISDEILMCVTNGEMYAAIETEINKVEIKIENESEGLRAEIEANKNSIELEVERAMTAEGSIGSKLEIAESNIGLKVSKGDVSSQISVESGKVEIGSNRLVVDSTNFKLSGSGTITASGTISSTSGTARASINSGGLYFYEDENLTGSFIADSIAGSGLVLSHRVMEIDVAQEGLIMSIGNRYSFAFNNGLEPNGNTDRIWIGGNTHIDGTLHQNGNITFCDTYGNEKAFINSATDDNGVYGAWVNGCFYVLNNFYCYGEKYRIVETENYDNVGMSAIESTVALFADIGSAITDTQGDSYVYIDPIFAETIDSIHEYQVFICQTSNGSIEWVEKFDNYFIAHGEPNVSFDWIVYARQKNYQDLRMRKISVTSDNEVVADESIFYSDDIGANASDSYMNEFKDTIEEQAFEYLNEYEREVTNYD